MVYLPPRPKVLLPESFRALNKDLNQALKSHLQEADFDFQIVKEIDLSREVGPLAIFLSETEKEIIPEEVQRDKLFVIFEQENLELNLFANEVHYDREDVLTLAANVSIDQLGPFLKGFFGGHEASLEQSIYKSCEKNLKQVLKLLKKHDKEKWPASKMKIFYSPLDDLKEACQSVESRKDFSLLIEEFNKAHRFFEKIEYQPSDAVKHIDENSFPIEEDKGRFGILNLLVRSDYHEVKAYLITTLVRLFADFEKRNSYLNALVESTRLWRTIFSSIPFPMGLFSLSGELIHHNPSLTNLNMTGEELLQLENQSTINVEDLSYKLYKKTIVVEEEKYQFLILLEGIQNLSSLDTGQLGIITSSVAHELNNPLAGILAALALLELEDELGEEEKTSLKEMKASTTRCKYLVETFLGFSRANVNRAQGSLKECLEQSLNLLRYRMAENNIKISLNFESSHEGPTVNPSIVTMVFYLLFGDLLTAYSHFMLLTFSAAGGSKNIQINCQTAKNLIELNIDPHFEFAENLKKSKLLNYLIQLENFKMTMQENKILLTRQKDAH